MYDGLNKEKDSFLILDMILEEGFVYGRIHSITYEQGNSSRRVAALVMPHFFMFWYRNISLRPTYGIL